MAQRSTRWLRSNEAGVLARELADYQISVSDAGHASFNARSGKHDDLVIGLSLSVGIERPAFDATTHDYWKQEPPIDAWASQRERIRQGGR